MVNIGIPSAEEQSDYVGQFQEGLRSGQGSLGARILLLFGVVFESTSISGTDWLEVPTIYKAEKKGLCKGISPQNIALYGTVPPF